MCSGALRVSREEALSSLGCPSREYVGSTARYSMSARIRSSIACRWVSPMRSFKVRLAHGLPGMFLCCADDGVAVALVESSASTASCTSNM